MQRQRRQSIISIFLLVIFASYYVGTTAFMHTHFYPHYSITHSHPFARGVDGLPHHTHTGTAFETIQTLDSFLLELQNPFLLLLFTVYLLLLLQAVRPMQGIELKFTSRLRAPPSFLFL